MIKKLYKNRKLNKENNRKIIKNKRYINKVEI